MEGLDGEIVIVDNESQDGSWEQFQAVAAERGWAEEGRIRVQRTGHNGGFGSGNNHAIRAGLSGGRKPDYVYLMNPDAVPEAGAIRALAGFMEAHPRAGAAGSLILTPDGTPAYGAFRFPSILREFEDAARTNVLSRLLDRGREPSPVALERREVDWVSGSSVMFRQATLDAVGLFDESFFLYFEETDLCLRIKRAGWEIWSVPESRVTHIGGVATGMGRWDRVPQYWFDSRFHYFRKNYGLPYTLAVTASLLAGEVVWSLRKLLNPKAERYRNTRRFGRDLLRHHLAALFSRPPDPPAPIEPPS
ncbi:MAG: glycosyl transferase [Rhodobacterales bacterium]|nr:MAG: glycosyl transferase [Rhodobacterales bacterium]